MNSPILKLQGVSAGYGGGDMIAGLSLELEQGDILCLAGESGSGKSTLAKAILGIDPDLHLTGGTILFQDQDITKLGKKERRRICGTGIGMISQNPGASFNPIRSYEKQFRETLKSHGRYDASKFRSLVLDAFHRLGLEDGERILQSCPYEMSGGMNQRIALALVLLLSPALLLADEPTSALDVTVQKQVADELRKLQQTTKITQIVITHNLGLASWLATQIGIMYGGRLVEYGPASRVLHNPVHPYTRSLLAAVPSLGGKIPEGLEGQPPLNGPGLPGCAFAPRCPRIQPDCRTKGYQMVETEYRHFACCQEGNNGNSD